MADQSCNTGGKHSTNSKNWNKIILRHAVAWSVLLCMGAIIWKLAMPFLPADILKATQTNGGPASESIGAQPQGAAQSPAAGSNSKTAVKSATTTTLADSTKARSQTAIARVQVLVNALNVRAIPSKDGQIIGSLNRGVVVKVVESNGPWLKIVLPGGAETGYISANTGLVAPLK